MLTIKFIYTTNIELFSFHRGDGLVCISYVYACKFSFHQNATSCIH